VSENRIRIYGKNACLEYLRAARGANKHKGRLLLARRPGCAQAAEARGYAAALGFACLAVSRRELDQLCPGKEHQGFVLDMEGGTSSRRRERESRKNGKQESGFGVAPPVKEARDYDWRGMLRLAIERGGKPKVLILDGVQDTGNLGAIVRSAAQFGIACIFIPRDNACTFTDAARKSASGGEHHVPIAQVVNLARLLEELKDMGFWSAAACGDGAASLKGFDFNFPYAIILGSEGKGARRLLLEKADHTIRIPMTGCIDSLNVSVAAGIIMYEMYVSSPFFP
jgi:23S rRNA (guanosine2251-2'-O)-methyltransferase